MKMKFVSLLLLLTAVIALAGSKQNVTAQEIISDNLFTNPGWEAGYHNQDSIPQIAVPNGWRMHWLDGVAFEGTEDRPAYRPETVVWNIQDAPEHERPLFFRDGSYTLKIFKSWAPMYAAISQDVSGLEVGRKYRIVAPVFVDIVEEYKAGKKVPPWNLSQGFVRFGVGSLGATWRNASQINYSPTWSGENVSPFYQTMPIFVWDFVATQSDATIFIEMGSMYPFQNNGFFIDGVGLFALNERNGNVSAPPAAGGGGGNAGSSAAPAPTLEPAKVEPRPDGSIVHVVGPGDSFWSIAIKYAPTLGISAEETLPIIQELNDNPAFINGGQELLIREPGDYGDTPVEEAPAEEEAATEEETAAEESETAAEETPTEETETPTEEGSEEVIVVEGESLETESPDSETETAASNQPLAGICVSAFNDSNGNGQFDGAPESLKADAAITLFKDGETKSTYITDGVSDVHCFDNLEEGTYQVQLYPPANYIPTTADSWAVSVSEGVFIPLQFGMQFNPGGTEVAEVPSAEGDSAASNGEDTAESATDASTDTETDAAPTDTGNFLANAGGIVIIVAVILILLAGAGVVMLRRG
ncbi:MAG: hypothetical protein GY796_15225 [Chloroflexi bacterium]|nr:hypothetical protein [Chloroflexota bacterium]